MYPRSPRGRGDTIVVTCYPISHVSLDRGQTWRSVDLGATEPYRAVIEGMRMPGVAALPDGRLVIGYLQWWVATDATNTSFEEIDMRSPLLWQAELWNAPSLRPRLASADGGGTWVRRPSRHDNLMGQA